MNHDFICSENAGKKPPLRVINLASSALTSSSVVRCGHWIALATSIVLNVDVQLAVAVCGLRRKHIAKTRVDLPRSTSIVLKKKQQRSGRCADAQGRAGGRLFCVEEPESFSQQLVCFALFLHSMLKGP